MPAHRGACAHTPTHTHMHTHTFTHRSIFGNVELLAPGTKKCQATSLINQGYRSKGEGSVKILRRKETQKGPESPK